MSIPRDAQSAAHKSRPLNSRAEMVMKKFLTLAKITHSLAAACINHPATGAPMTARIATRAPAGEQKSKLCSEQVPCSCRRGRSQWRDCTRLLACCSRGARLAAAAAAEGVAAICERASARSFAMGNCVCSQQIRSSPAQSASERHWLAKSTAAGAGEVKVYYVCHTCIVFSRRRRSVDNKPKVEKN